MSVEKKTITKKTYKDYMDLIDVVCKVEYKRLTNSYMVDFDELQNIAIITVHTILEENPKKEFNITYLSVAIKWAIRNELRRRYNWYTAKADDDMEKGQVREAVYETILSIDEMAEGENPQQIKDNSMNQEDFAELQELNVAIREAIKKLPIRYREIIEARFYQDKKLKDLSADYDLSPSRITRIIQNGLEKVRVELKKQGLV
ncbi:MAG: sigma-70 family RNA polymerase sigma factor [bacterium]|nr:sigma-70 family RNA polymerase sigma factor [bacterium]